VEVELSELHLVFFIMPFETLLELTGNYWGFCYHKYNSSKHSKGIPPFHKEPEKQMQCPIAILTIANFYTELVMVFSIDFSDNPVI